MSPASLADVIVGTWRLWLWRGGLFAVAFLVTFAISLGLVAVLLVRLPATYFLDRHQRELWIDRHPAVRWLGVVLKNVLGVALVVLGAVLSLPGVPGQGLLTVLLGVMLIDFPGKRRLERRLVGLPRVLDRVNRLRARFGREPLVLDETPAGTEQDAS